MHASQFLNQSEAAAAVPVVVLAGPERHLKLSSLEVLKRELLGAEDEDLGLTRFGGKQADFRDVMDTLRTVSMWGERQVVLIEDADDFVSRNRKQLESALGKPAGRGVLLLDVGSWPKNTRLAKRVVEIGLTIECTELSGSQLAQWLVDQAQQKYEKSLPKAAASLMIELAGTSLGLLDQELSKLAAYVGDRKKISVEDVRRLVGGWRAEATWTMTGAIRDGNADLALKTLDSLLVAGEAPQRLLGGMNFVFRKLGKATELSRTGTPLPAALKSAGVYPRDVSGYEQFLRRIGRPRAERILERLLRADSGMKGGSRVADRIQLEQLVLDLMALSKHPAS